MTRLPGAGRLNRSVGAAAGSTLALALLVCGCVFAAMAGPALSLHTRTQALAQSVATLPDTSSTVQVTAALTDFTGPLIEDGIGAQQAVSTGQLDEATQQMAQGFQALPLPLTSDQWSGLNAKIADVSGAGSRAQAGAPPKLEVVYRDPLTRNGTLVAGTYASTGVPTGMLAVSATSQMAARFGLHPGSKLSLATVSGTVGLYVTGIVRESAPGSTFWTQDPTLGTPALEQASATSQPYWLGGVLADPDQLAAMQTVFTGGTLELNWEFPLTLRGVNADQVQGLASALNRAVTGTPALTGELAPSANALQVSSPLISTLTLFLATQSAIETVLLLLFVSLVVVGAAVIVLAARMIVARRGGELTLLRARGGSLGQVAAVMLRTAAIAAIPAAVIGAVLAIALIPGDAASLVLGWSLAGFAVLAALAGAPLIAVWQHRRAAPASNPALITSAGTGRPKKIRTSTAWRRPVAEITACAACVAGLVVLRDQGLAASGGTNLYLALVPVLVAVPVVLIMLRLYPLVIRGLLAVATRGAGATGFVALSRAARSSLTGVLPAFALVLALSLATFSGMVSGGIERGEVTASWQTTGADVLVQAGPGNTVTTPAVQAIAKVRGVRHVTAVWNTAWFTPYGQPVVVIGVDPSAYAAVVADTPFAAFPAAKLGSGLDRTLASGATVPVLASPAAAALLGRGATQLSSLYAMGPVNARVAGVLDSTPAQPGGGTYVVMPLEVLPGPNGSPAPSMILVTGTSIDHAQLTAVTSKTLPGSYDTFRTGVLASLASSPLQHGAALIIDLTIAAAAAFGLFIVILGLALGSAERELTLARLTVMGHERPTGLVLAEAMPAVLAAVAAGAVCAVVLPHLVGSSIDLSAFTGTGTPVEFSPDVTALGLPAVVICILALIVLVTEARAMGRRGITGMLRAN